MLTYSTAQGNVASIHMRVMLASSRDIGGSEGGQGMLCPPWPFFCPPWTHSTMLIPETEMIHAFTLYSEV